MVLFLCLKRGVEGEKVWEVNGKAEKIKKEGKSITEKWAILCVLDLINSYLCLQKPSVGRLKKSSLVRELNRYMQMPAEIKTECKPTCNWVHAYAAPLILWERWRTWSLCRCRLPGGSDRRKNLRWSLALFYSVRWVSGHLLSLGSFRLRSSTSHNLPEHSPVFSQTSCSACSHCCDLSGLWN